MINDIIIITTAICRIDIHNQSFNSYKNFLTKDYNIKWFINIDRPSYCKDSATETEENLRKILSQYELFIYHSEKPNFFMAVKKMLLASRQYITDNTCLLWLEDDWILNKECTVKYFIDSFLFPYSFISMVYNKLGSFPPFIMGSSLAKIFYAEFIKYNNPEANPETITRRIMRTTVQKIDIVYYNYINDLLMLSKIKNPITAGLVYVETYLSIPDSRILIIATDNKSHIFDNNIILPIDNLDNYKNQNPNKIIFLRFGTMQTNNKYIDSFFKDIGRPWIRNLLKQQ